MVRMIGSVLGTIILHGILLIIHRPGASRARSGQLTPEELFVGIAIFLAFKSCIVQLLMVIGSFLLIGLSVVAFNGQGEEENHQYASHGTGHMGLGFFSDNFASILRATLITWIVHLGLIYFLETGIPFCRQLLKSREKTLKKVNARLKAIYNFLKSTLNDPFSGSPFLLLEMSLTRSSIQTDKSFTWIDDRRIIQTKGNVYYLGKLWLIARQ